MQRGAIVNRLSEQFPWAPGVSIMPVDQRRRALEHRLELAKERLVEDLGRMSSILQSSAGTVKKSAVRAAVTIGALLVLGIVTAVVRRRRRLSWRFL